MFNKLTFIALITTLLSTFVLAKNIPNISQQEFTQLMSAEQANVLVLDVRTPEEYAEGHVPAAMNVTHTAIKENLANLMPHKDKKIIVYCRSGRRASIAAEILTNNGFNNVYHLSGDMNGWTKAGLPIEK
jgi:rhodanese-related sulfurtransferase